MLELLDSYVGPLRHFMAADFKATRKALGLSQLKMSELLDIDLRSYSHLEHGESLCSTPVLLRYVCFCKDDPAPFFERVKQIIDTAMDDLAG